MVDRTALESIFDKYECTNFKWIDPQEIVTAQWVRIKCTFGCGNYGKRACCPPNVPSVSECQQFLNEYTSAVIFHFPKTFDRPDDRHEWGRGVNEKLMGIEREAFLLGHQKTFLLLMSTCSVCEECTGIREDCRYPKSARPTPEAVAIDVYSTVKKYGFPIKVLSDYTQTMNKYAFLLIE